MSNHRYDGETQGARAAPFALSYHPDNTHCTGSRHSRSEFRTTMLIEQHLVRELDSTHLQRNEYGYIIRIDDTPSAYQACKVPSEERPQAQREI